jgi:hypothetical protein
MNPKQLKRFIVACTILIVLNTVTRACAQRGDAKPPNATVFTDNFDRDHDFLSQGVSDSGWDGFLGKGPRETVDRLIADEGKLTLQSTHGRYQEGWKPLGPLLYKTATGDFKATVRVVDYQNLSFNNCGIMARAASLADAGPGEDWISVDYFPIYGGIYARMADDNRRKEKGSNG